MMNFYSSDFVKPNFTTKVTDLFKISRGNLFFLIQFIYQVNKPN